ncbi:MAG: hypothetical protein JWP82_389 [Humibacillus sp.]|nr:hypothetical protein [Humibacillus sp.]
MPDLPHLAHVPMPLAGDGSSVAHVVRALTREHARLGGRSTVITSDNREATYPDATTVPVDYTENCPRTHFTAAEYRQDYALGALLLQRPHGARLFEPAARALGAVAPDWVVVHEGHYAVTSLALFRRALPRTTRIALHLHNAISATVLRPELSKLLLDADAVIAISGFTADGVRRRAWFDRRKIVTVPNGVDLDRFPSVERGPRQDGPIRLLFVGQVAPHKGVHLVLLALAALGRHAERFETRVVGSSELATTGGLSDYEVQLRETASAVAGPVSFGPYRSQAGVSELYAWADVVVVPSVAEPFGMVALEAMASGAHVLANATGALPEVLGPVGRHVEPTVAGWVCALDELTRAEIESSREVAAARGRSFTWARSHAALLAGLERLGPRG